ncbi:MAG: M50 family metallopeptidase [Lachnospiraceae bacterium]|nr:M50 family metallopeptidase [Lachnospiraceae bacterium]
MKKEKILSYIIFLVIGGIMGAILGRYLATSKSSYPELAYALFCLILSFYASVIIHEGGHFVMGHLTGYTFVSFRIGSLTWIKGDGKLLLKRFHIPGTGGQCLLMPPESEKPEEVPFFLYHLGGGLFNFITAGIFLPIGLFCENKYGKAALVIFGVWSLLSGLFNLIPMKLQVANDGYNLVELSRNKSVRVSLYKQLRINGLLYQGYIPSEIPEELFRMEDSSKGIYHGIEKMLRGSLFIDRKDFGAAEKLFGECIEDKNLISIYVSECKSELLFCKVMNGASREEIDALYDKELEGYIKASGKTQISKKRTMYAYDLIYKRDEAAAEKEYEAAMRMRKTYPALGELKSELSLIEYVKEQGFPVPQEGNI